MYLVEKARIDKVLVEGWRLGRIVVFKEYKLNKYDGIYGGKLCQRDS